MWNLAILFLFILHVNGKSSNLCRMNPPRCDGDKLIHVDVVRCIKPADPTLWASSKIMIQHTCDRVNVCDINQLKSVVESCCGDPDYTATKRPKLRFAYDCIQGETFTKTTLPPKMPTTFSSPAVNAVTTKDMASSVDTDSFCVTKMCQQKPYCSAGTEIAIMKISNSSESDQVMNSLTYYCNKRQRCTEDYEPYVHNRCKSDDHMQLHYVCMKVFPAVPDPNIDNTELPWTRTCQDHMPSPGPMNMTTPKSNPSTSEMSKVTMFKHPSSTNPSKDMHMVHKTEANPSADELSTAPHIVIPDGIPVDTDVVDKIEPMTIPVMPSTVGSSSSRPSSDRDVSPVGKTPDHPTHHENREKASSVSDTPTTGLYSREVVIGLIAGVVILACLVIILLTALVASMRRRRRSLADDEERDERHNSGPGGTTNENMASFQYLKNLPPEGDNGTLGTRSQQSEDSLGGDSTSKKSLISKPIKKKNSLAPSENGSSKTADTISSKDDSVFHCLKNTDDYSNILNESNKSVDSGHMTKNDNSFTGRSRLDADVSKPVENHESKGGDDDVFKDVPHFYVNGDDYALVQKDSSRSPRSTLISDKPSIYANSSPRPKSGSSGSTQDSDVLEWTKGFNLAV